MNIIPDSTSCRIKRYSKSDFYVTLFDPVIPCLTRFKCSVGNLAELLSFLFETWSYTDADLWLRSLVIGDSYEI